MVNFVYNDGGRHLYFKGDKVGDCGTRSIAIVTAQDYKIVYDELFELQKAFLKRRPSLGKNEKSASPRNFLYRDVATEYLARHGFKWVALAGIGKTPLKVFEVAITHPNCMMRLAKHFSAMVDGRCHDTWAQHHNKIVYGIWVKI